MRFAAALIAACLALPLSAQERANTILVMDASGSMWGQIDGVNKIVIARDVVAGILADFPADENLGLTVYGHRTRGDCTDIETLIAPAPGTAQAIIDAVNTINPRGMTPMTDSVIAAADALRYTEQAATVILVSDGIETCNPDPCAAARALEQAGIAFTAHVVGFDVGSEPDALAQMQCLADETGGQFLTAANAEELNLAMETILAAPVEPEPEPIPEPEPGPNTITFQAITEFGGPVDDAIFWAITGPAGPVSNDQQVSGYETDLVNGNYMLTATRPSDGAVSEIAFTVSDAPQVVTATFPDPAMATVKGPADATIAATIQVTWTGPDSENDFISIGLVGEDSYETYAFTRNGNPVDIVVPGVVGDYEIRYQTGSQNRIIGTAPLRVTELAISVTGPASAPAGATIPVSWAGPNADSDFVGVSVPGEGGYVTYAYTRNGNPVDLVMPSTPGDYELRYFLGRDNSVLASSPITVTSLDITLDGPASADIGATVDIGWAGPNYDSDFIGVGLPGEDGYVTYAYTRNGNPLGVVMPTVPGDYELRYFIGFDNSIQARRAITVNPITVTLDAPASAPAGSMISVGHTGPHNDADFIGVGPPGEVYQTYSYARDGSPVMVRLPPDAGTYELRYYAGSDNSVLATTTITTTEVDAKLTSPATASAGTEFAVDWGGPDYDGDFISIGLAGDDDYITYASTRSGHPAILLAPDQPGEYEVRYQLGQGSGILARMTITVTAPDK